MVRIGGGVFPEIKERDYLGNGNYRVDSQAGKVSLVRAREIHSQDDCCTHAFACLSEEGAVA